MGQSLTYADWHFATLITWLLAIAKRNFLRKRPPKLWEILPVLSMFLSFLTNNNSEILIHIPRVCKQQPRSQGPFRYEREPLSLISERQEALGSRFVNRTVLNIVPKAYCLLWSARESVAALIKFHILWKTKKATLEYRIIARGWNNRGEGEGFGYQ